MRPLLVVGALLAAAAPVAAQELPPPPSSSRWQVAGTVLGLVAILVLIWLGSHPRVRRLEEALGLRQIISTGFVFVLLGLAARHPAVGVLSDQVLDDLTPLLHVALGWTGLLIGFQFDVRLLESLPPRTAITVTVESVLPFVAVSAAGAGMMLLFGEARYGGTFLRDALVLGTAGAITVARVRERRSPYHQPEELSAQERIGSLDEIVAVAGLALIASLYRPLWLAFRWDLSGTVWLLLTLGLGTAVALVIHAALRGKLDRSEGLAITVGGAALGAGAAGYLYLAPLVVCAVAGAVLANLPGEHRQRMWPILVAAERPVYYLLLTVAGALWDPADWRGWALLPAFVASRALALWVAGRWVRHAAGRGDAVAYRPEDPVAPISIVSIAIVVSAQALYQGRAIPWIVTAVLGAAIAIELFTQVVPGRRRRPEGAL